MRFINPFTHFASHNKYINFYPPPQAAGLVPGIFVLIRNANITYNEGKTSLKLKSCQQKC